MPPIDEVKQSVDRFFAAADGEKMARGEELGLDYEMPHQSATACDSLRALRTNTDDELFEKVAEAIANDPRITKHLPALSLEALSSKGDLRPGRHFEVSRLINSYNDSVISRDEASTAAKNTVDFDPVHHKALQYFRENYDLFRGLCGEDEILFGRKERKVVNSIHVTIDDLRLGATRVFDQSTRTIEAQDLARLGAIDKVIDSFGEIDADNSGKISFSEGRKWADRQIDRYKLIEFLPADNENRLLRGSNYLTRQNLRDMRVNMIAVQESTPPFFR